MYEAIIGLEVHAEIDTLSKMFCGCPVVDLTQAEPNSAVCPVCSGMPGTLPVVNQRAVEYGLRVALALGCETAPVSIFARKNYFYPDLPKGYQISQYKEPLARNGLLHIRTQAGERAVRIRRVHLEEDTGKLTHSDDETDPYSLVDLNRAGVPLLEIVSEPDLRSAAEARVYGEILRNLLRYLRVNTGDMQKGVLRFEANVSVRPVGEKDFRTRTEIKNLNSFRALERGLLFEIDRQRELHEQGKPVIQQTMGWDENRQVTVPQRGKEEEDDYRYFPEPDLPPLVVSAEWAEEIRNSLPELPQTKFQRFRAEYELSDYDADILVAEQGVADFFEEVVEISDGVNPKLAANWVTGELFGLMNQVGVSLDQLRVSPQHFSGLLKMLEEESINTPTAKTVLAKMFESGQSAEAIVESKGLSQISDADQLAQMVSQVLDGNPDQVAKYFDGKESLANWFFGQVMRVTKGKANPQVVKDELAKQLSLKK
ncbi:MAG: Asp-tRNA(Asn)/Glu-tRNA(Gln) amidotransferase subunit GatB [Anaerolineales bacterium]|nr:Asp-tRNA(Asn)/Glu-tRNA(Gln) amidotransferase subunit GatB [Chloroflexota bacterium]MBL6981083.1 Asp-tRNA(Asn)/Glu-tRNA(Gln) amidotransferase subunit GatB [Anaerolineales bacterium]